MRGKWIQFNLVPSVPDRKPPYKLLSSLRRDVKELYVLALLQQANDTLENRPFLRVFYASTKRAWSARLALTYFSCLSETREKIAPVLFANNTRSNFWRGGSGMTGRIKRKSCTSLSHASKQEKNFCKNIYINDWWKHVTLLSSLEKADDVSIFCTPYSLIESYHLFDRVKVLSKA